MKKHVFLIIGLCCGWVFLHAQVKFKLSFDKSSDQYIVSLVPKKTYQIPENLTGTAQVTIKAPAGKFYPVAVEGLYPGLDWEFNSMSERPEEAPDFDYFSFALINYGLLHLPYEAGKEIRVLAFKNENGCICPVSLVDNRKDPFMPPNSQNVNIGNTIAVYGYGIDAYGGVEGEEVVNCLATYTHDVPGRIDKFDLYPIPAENEIFLEFTWNGKKQTVRAEIVDVLGRIMDVKAVEFIPGQNLVPFKLQNLAAGSYFLKLKGQDWEETLDKFQKIRS